MTRYIYSVLRCVPNPNSGEFINFGVIAGDPISNSWSIKVTDSHKHLLKLASSSDLESVNRFVDELNRNIRSGLSSANVSGIVGYSSWLHKLYNENRSLIQLSEPLPYLANNVSDVIDSIYDIAIIKPRVRTNTGQSSMQVAGEISNAYHRAKVNPKYIHEKVRIFSEGSVDTALDFAIANGSVFQLSQAWSFQQTGPHNIEKDVRAWALGLHELRFGNLPTYLLLPGNHRVQVNPDVQLAVVTAPPKTKTQIAAYKNSQEIFNRLEIIETGVDETSVLSRSLSAQLFT